MNHLMYYHHLVGISSPDYGIPPSPAHTRSYGKATKPKKDRVVE